MNERTLCTFGCAICDTTLVEVRGVGFTHPTRDQNADHLPVPMLRTTMFAAPTCCDFCTARGVFAFLPVRDFTTPTGFDMHGPWAACHICADLVDTGQWGRLAAHTVTSLVRHIGGMSGDEINQIYETYRILRGYIAGPLTPARGVR